MTTSDHSGLWDEQFEQALRADDQLAALRAAVAGLRDRGASKEQLRAALEEFRLVLQRTGREDDEDVVLEVLDFLTGWSSPHTAID